MQEQKKLVDACTTVKSCEIQASIGTRRSCIVAAEGQECPICLGALEDAVNRCDEASHLCCLVCADTMRRNDLPECPHCRPELSVNFGAKEEASEHLYRALGCRLQAERLPDEALFERVAQGDMQRKSLALFERVLKMDPANAKAQNNLGIIYEKGLGVEDDTKKAIEWYGKAAEQGDTDALCNLGLIYAKGAEKVGLKQDFHSAAKLYRKAADMGAREAQLNLGAFYYHGAGVPQDFKKAAEWYRKAAVQGDADAQCNLAICYHKGEGLAVDVDKAAQWFKKAAAQGQEQALMALKELK
jgi:TPR repeat protein